MTSKLIMCLSVFTKEEWISFRKYLLMKTGKESDNFQVFEALQKRKVKLVEMKNANQIHQVEFGHMSQKAFANLLSRLTTWLEEWLVMFDAQKNKWYQNLMLVEGYNKRGLYQLADQVYHKSLKQIEEDESVEHDRIIASLHKAQYYSDNPIKNEKGAALLEDVTHSYFSWHSKESSLYLSELYNWGDIQHVDFKYEKQICQQIILEDHYSPVFSSVVKLVSEKDPQYLLQLIEELESNKVKEGTLTYIILLNYCLTYYMRLCNQGKINDPPLLIQLYDLGMNTGSFFSNGKIPMRRFHNIVNAISTCVSKIDCDQFINRWANLVSTKDVESSRKIALALSCLNYEEYSDIIVLLQGITHVDLTSKLRANALLIPAFYEEGDEFYDVLLNHLFNYKRQLKRNQSKISHKLFHAYKNLCEFVEILASKQKANIKNIDLSNYSYLMYRTWANRTMQKLNP